MKNPFLGRLALAVTILGLTSSQLFAQLAFKSVGSVQKKDGPMQVTVVFSEPMDPATAGVKDNYSLGGGVTINTATMLTGLPGLNDPGNGDPPLRGRVIDNQCVILEVTGLGTAKTTLTLQNDLKNADLSKTLVKNTTFDFVPSGYSWAEMARIYTLPTDPGWVSPGHREGKIISDSTNGFDIFNNGRAGWAGEDEFTFAYKPVTGDYTFQSRLEFADSASRWSRAGIMVRERLDDDVAEGCQSRYMTAHADPPKAFSDTVAAVVAGNNTYESNARIIDYSGLDTTQPDTSPGCGHGGNGLHTSFANDTVGAGAGTPQYPIAWVRLQRTGDTIEASWSNDGTTWTVLATRTFDPPLPATMYWGPAYCAEWGNINAANGAASRSRYYLTQHRWGQLTTPYVISPVVGSPVGFVAQVQNLQSQMVPSTLALQLDGTNVTATSVSAPDASGVITITYKSPDILTIATHDVKIQFNDNNVPPNLITKLAAFDVSYVSVPEEYATTTFSGTKGSLMASAHMMPNGTDGTQIARGLGDNSVAAAETEIEDGVIDPSTGQPVANAAPTTIPELVNGYINYTQTPIDAGYFNASSTNAGAAIADISPMPGGVGNPSDSEYVVQFYGYADLKKGAYRMFVNSDDGFRLSFGPNALDVLGMTAGIFDGGRGMTLNGDPAPFDFVVTKDGVYPFRILFEQGYGTSGNDASIEWYMLDSSGNRVLVNDTAAPVKTYPTGRGRAYVSKFLPYPGSNGVVPRPTLSFAIVDDLTTVAANTVQVTLDSAVINVSAVKNGGTTTWTWTPAADYPFESAHTGALVYQESSGVWRTNAINFTIKGFLPSDLPASSMWIEVEDFDFGGGKWLAIADTAIGTDATPYTGGGYDGIQFPISPAPILDTDYHKPIGPLNGTALGGYVYRTDIPGWLDPGTDTKPGYFVPLSTKTDGTGIASTRPGGVTVTVNYNTGWSGGSWYNYTRTVPNGIYRAFLAACHWNDTDPPTAGQIDSALDQVTAGVGTANQTLQRLGTFYGPANHLIDTYTTLRGSDGTPAVMKLSGKTTLRLTVNAGDSDYVVLAPATGVPAKITDATPANGATASRGTAINVRIEDFNTTVTLNTVKLFVDTVDVTAQANPTKPADVTTMSYLPSGGWVANSTHTYIVRFTDSASTVIAVTNTFNVNALGAPGQFVIEAEDFNYGGGLEMPAANTMPYPGLAYAGLDAVLNVDYVSHNADQQPTYVPAYRATATNAAVVKGGQQVCINENGGVQLDRGSWTVTDNYKIGWAGGGAWFNYTRTFSAGTYNVYAALSDGSDPVNPHGLNGAMDLVTSGVTTTSQTLVRLGTFDQIGTGPNSWGNNALVPMKDNSGATATVNLGGSETVRFTSQSGDIDYFVFVPGATPASPSIVTPPATQSVTNGATVTFSVIASGTGPLTYQWHFKGAALTGETNATLTIANADSSKNGNYSVTVSGAAVPPVTSADAILTVSAGLPQFTSVTVNPDKSITLVWTGAGVLEVTTSLHSPISWTPVPTAASPYTFTPDPANGPVLFGRIHGP